MCVCVCVCVCVFVVTAVGQSEQVTTQEQQPELPGFYEVGLTTAHRMVSARAYIHAYIYCTPPAQWVWRIWTTQKNGSRAMKTNKSHQVGLLAHICLVYSYSYIQRIARTHTHVFIYSAKVNLCKSIQTSAHMSGAWTTVGSPEHVMIAASDRLR